MTQSSSRMPPECFASRMEKCCLENNILFKILLIAGNAPVYPPFIGDFHPFIKVVFLPLNITLLIWIKDLQQLLRPTTGGGPLPRLVLQLNKMLRRCCCSPKFTWAWGDSSTEYMLTSGRRYSRGLSMTSKEEVAKINKIQRKYFCITVQYVCALTYYYKKSN